MGVDKKAAVQQYVLISRAKSASSSLF